MKAGTEPVSKSCDAKSVIFHRHRARMILRHAYQGNGPKRSEIRSFQQQKLCIRDKQVRKSLAALRDRLKAKLEARQSWCSPHPDPAGAGCWVIPASCVMAESGGSWTAQNPASPARGPYQLLSHGEPWPVTTRAQAMEHHRIAAALYASSGLSPWVAC